MDVEMRNNMKKRVLKQLQKGEITSYEAYNKIYKVKPRRARFAKLKIDVQDSPGVSRFLRFLFLLPLPLFFASFAVKKLNEQEEGFNLSIKELKKYARGTKILVESDEANVHIRIL